MSYTKLEMLTQQMHLEPAEDTECPQISSRKRDSLHISQAVMPNGKYISLLKTLLTSVCERNCLYCPFRSDREFQRATFRPENFAKVFMFLHSTRKVDGLFLSSGIVNGGMKAQDNLLITAEILRYQYDFRGYLHLKILPGADYSQVEKAMKLADRISINLEAPNSDALNRLAPEKRFYKELFSPILWASEIRANHPPHNTWNKKWPSMVSQFVVGGADENDYELLETSELLINKMKLARIYYSAFNPIPDTPLENKPQTPMIRQIRLYQAFYLIRDYKFSLKELPIKNGNLPLSLDPKLAWAKENLQDDFIEINTATKEMLLRVPGIGTRGVQAILAARKKNKLVSLSSLKRLGIQVNKAAPFILMAGKRPPYQENLF